MTRHWTIVCVVGPVQQHQRRSVRGAADMANQPNPVHRDLQLLAHPATLPVGLPGGRGSVIRKKITR